MGYVAPYDAVSETSGRVAFYPQHVLITADGDEPHRVDTRTTIA